MIVTCVPPFAGPESGVIESIFGLPGGNRKSSSDVSLLSELGCEQSGDGAHLGVDDRRVLADRGVVSFVSLARVKLYCVPNENGVAMSANVTIVAWLANPEPSISIGVPPVSGPAGVPGGRACGRHARRDRGDAGVGRVHRFERPAPS